MYYLLGHYDNCYIFLSGEIRLITEDKRQNYNSLTMQFCID
jgi:hypothetical protein